MRINFNDIKFVRKDRTLFSHPFRTIMEETKTGFVYDDNSEGVALIPYRIGANGREVLIRDEYSPLHSTVLSIITGRRDEKENGRDWWRATAKRELLEEAGIACEARWFENLGTLITGGDQKNPDTLCMIDVTGLPQNKPKTDGTVFEKKSSNMWTPVSDLLRILREPSTADTYLLSAIAIALEAFGMWQKSQESDLEKAKKGEQRPGHKYIRREGSDGKYKYIYTEPKGKTGKADDKKGKPKGGLLAQLTELLGKKQGDGEEKVKKLLPFDAWPIAPADLPEFSKGVTAAQWISNIERMVDTNVAKEIAIIDDGTYELMNSPEAKFGYIDQALRLMDAKNSKYAGSEANWKDLNVENKKLDEQGKNEVKKAMLQASAALGIVNHTIAVLNSSVAENVLNSFANRIKASDLRESLNDYPAFEKLSQLTKEIKKSLNVADSFVQDTKWLQGVDPKLDWLTDSVFAAVDKLMKTRNRFVQNVFSMYLEQISDKIDSLDDGYAIESAATLINSFETFKKDSMHSSVLSKDNKTFANQWNMKQKGIYSGASRFSAHATSKVIDKIRGLQGTPVADDVVISRLITKLADQKAFSFLSFNRKGANIFNMSEQAFSYVNEHGLDKYYQDIVFLAGGRKLFSGGAAPEINVAKEKSYIDAALDVLDRTYKGEDIFDAKARRVIDSKFGMQLGDMAKGSGNSWSFDQGAFSSAVNTMVLLNDKSPSASKSAAFVRMWSSASHNSLMSNALETLVDAKGIDRGTYVNYHLASNRVNELRRLDVRDTLSKTIRGVYEDTQKFLTRYWGSNVPETITLYRANGANEVKSVASSWTTDRAVAHNFGHVVSKAEVPSEALLLYKNKDNEDYWTYPYEQEHIVVPGLLPLEKKLTPKAIYDEAVGNIIND